MAGKAPLPVASIEGILASGDLGENTIDVPGWGGSVKIRGLSRAEVRNFSDDPVEAEVKVLTAGVVDPQISEEQARQILQGKAGGPVNDVMQEILKLSGLGAAFRSE